MKVYAFFDGGMFQRFPSIVRALSAVRGLESRVYVHVPGVPNPWWVHPIKNGKVNYSKIYKSIPKKRFEPFSILEMRIGTTKSGSEYIYYARKDQGTV